MEDSMELLTNILDTDSVIDYTYIVHEGGTRF